MQRPDLLFLCHRIPYPPNKGDKIRSWHILDHLAERFRVHLGCFVDHPDDWQHTDLLRDRCGGDCYFAPLRPLAARLKSLVGLATGDPLSLTYYRHRGLAAWAAKLRQEIRPKVIYVFSSTMAPFAGDGGNTRRLLDLCDIDSDKWTQYASRQSGPMRWVYAREGRLLATYERRMAERFDAVLLVSNNEAALFRRQAPAAAARIHHLGNGVDLDYFSPAQGYPNPFAGGSAPIVFTGAMDYWPNIDAVIWFADEILPLVRRQVPTASFAIVGSGPAPAVRRLGEREGIVVTGRVADVRPYLAHAGAVVAPMRIARGVQNKVLEAMAMANSVIVTTMATQGLEPEARGELVIADEPMEMAAAVVAALACPKDGERGVRARQRVIDHYGWPASMAKLDAIIDGTDPLAAGSGLQSVRAQR